MTMVKKTLLLAAILMLLRPGGVWARAEGGNLLGPPQAEEEQQYKDQQRAMEQQKAQLEAQKKTMEEQRKAMEKVRHRIYLLESRPRLGLVLRTDADEKQDAQGATVEAVTPGGPAEEAGIKAGDVITKFNGQSLAGPFKGAGEDESAPAARLVDLASKMKEGEKVSLEFLRGGAAKSVTVTPRVMGSRTYRFRGDDGEVEDFEAPELPEIPDVERMLREVPEIQRWAWIGRSAEWLDMEMVPMNPELGDYFGTKEGILIIQAPKDSPLKVRGGDVILRIGDRDPKSPSQVMRILASYEPGETVNIQVLRKQKRESLSFKVPERRKEWNRRSDEPAPAPPAAPAPPRAPKPTAGDPPQGANGGRA
jgi:C-terminal processing protease CtpA/Prc